MKIEKVSDNQIRCTLTKEDLASRQLKISELAYGTDKAKNLFRDMMQKANFEFGFEAEDIPLMIEAVPVSGDSIVLIITKVEDPEELDTRFSRFAPSIHDEIESTPDDDASEDDALDSQLHELFQKYGKSIADDMDTENVPMQQLPTKADASDEVIQTHLRLVHFDKISALLTMCEKLRPTFPCESTLYKDIYGGYLLLLSYTGTHTQALPFHKLCNSISEYGALKKVSTGNISHFDEHFDTIIEKNALSQLTML